MSTIDQWPTASTRRNRRARPNRRGGDQPAAFAAEHPQARSIHAHDDPSPDEYVGRSPEGTRAGPSTGLRTGLGAARRSARESKVDTGWLMEAPATSASTRRTR